MLNESDLVQLLQKESDGFIGDDAAILPLTHSEHYVVTKDLLIEDIHFRTQYYTESDLANKALHVNLSDLCAMGAAPKFILCGIAIPEAQADYGRCFLASLLEACKATKVLLIGGDTTRSTDKLTISITAIGTAKPEHIKYRTGAQHSNFICTVGNLGHAHLGLVAHERNRIELAPPAYKQACLRPQAKLQEGIWLGGQLAVTSMIDLSDGLFLDLKRLCQASNVSGVIDINQLTSDGLFLKTCTDLKLDPLNTILTGGEDYALLCTVKMNDYPRLAHDFFNIFGYPLQHIGHITAGSGAYFTEKGQKKELSLTPFTHFGEKG